MKILSRCWLVGLVCLLLTACPDQTESNGIPQLRVGMDPAVGFPFVYKVEETNALGGFEYEVAAYLAQKNQHQLVVEEMRWENLLQAVADKKIDVALNAIEKPEDKAHPELHENLAFTTHYYTAFQQLVVQKSDDFTYNISDLKSKKVGVISPSVGELLLQEVNKAKQAQIKLVTYGKPETLFKDLSQGKLNASLTERAVASWYSWKYQDKLRLTGEPITQEIPYVGVVHLENRQLLNQLNKSLEAARDDTEFQKIFEKWHLVIKR